MIAFCNSSEKNLARVSDPFEMFKMCIFFLLHVKNLLFKELTISNG
jgi:hypothetical protein